jgi:probable rRNA maturation factor
MIEVDVIFATRRPWVPSRSQVGGWVRAALGRRRGAWAVAVRIVGSAESRRLNLRYRRRDKPTNVLSFAATVRRADGRRQLGDLVVCAPVVAAEAREQRKTRAAHWAHMIVHGSLHLCGFDHQKSAEAKRMERRETRVLRSLGYPDPYSEQEMSGMYRSAPRGKAPSAARNRIREAREAA